TGTICPILNRCRPAKAVRPAPGPRLARMPIMPRVSLVLLVAAGLAVAIVPTVRGQSPNSIGRYLGIGWSDGYHSHTACPPKPHAIHQQPVVVPVVTPVPAAAPAPVPWWKVPAAPPESAPT